MVMYYDAVLGLIAAVIGHAPFVEAPVDGTARVGGSPDLLPG